MQYRWRTLPEPQPSTVNALQQQLGIDPALCTILAQRGISTFEEARQWFRPQLSHLHDPFLMLNMATAVERINTAIAQNERILIYGDYDVDGTTAVSLMYSFLKKHYPHLDTYIPDRYKEGYGVSLTGIDYAEDNGMSLIIALDCGIKAIDKVEYASSKGIDFIICDHHRPGATIPKAVAVLDPKQEDCEYPFDELSGCGVGFKLVQALCKAWQLPDEEWHPLLDLLAISIGADIVPIVGENRVLAYFGLQLINSTPRAGIKLLIDLSGKKTKALTITDVVFMIGPRINAAGRISHGRLAVELLTGEDINGLEDLSKTINEHNNERKELDSNITLSALEMIATEADPNRRSTVVFDKTWHKGVIGIVASRLIENHYRPTIVFTESNGVLAGSARSVKGFDIYNALDQCSDVLEQFGGHMYAAGMTLKKERYEAFRQRFEEVVQRNILPDQLTPEIEIDCTVELSSLNFKFYRVMMQMAPFGPQNMAPTFQTHNLLDAGSKVVGADQTHLRLVLREPKSGVVLTGIAFGMADKISILRAGKPVSVAYHLDENEFNGNVNLQMRVKDVKLTEELA
jgi:single-stranded-DNA-specific exonuclease